MRAGCEFCGTASNLKSSVAFEDDMSKIGMVHFGKNLTCQLGRHIQKQSGFGIRNSGFGIRDSGFKIRTFRVNNIVLRIFFLTIKYY